MTRIAPLFAVLGLIALLTMGQGPAGAQTADGATAAAPANAQGPGTAPRVGPTGLPLPRFVSLRAPEVNLRTGPGVRYPIDWVYHRAGLPLEVIDEFETWRRVRDWEGSVGWVHQSMLTGDRKVMVIDKQRLLRREPEPAATGAALLDPGVLAELKTCAGDWCQVRVGEMAGWLMRAELFGIRPDEEVH